MIEVTAELLVSTGIVALAVSIFCRTLLQNNDIELSAEEFANFKYLSSSSTNLLSPEHREAIASRQWKKVMAWIAFHSDQVSRVEDIRGQTVLHHAALFRAPANVMELLLWAAPELASVPNKDGELAIHWAVRLCTPNPVLMLLLRAFPESAFWEDSNQSTPLSLMWERHQLSLLQVWRTQRQRLENETDHVWRRIMLVYRALYECQVRTFSEDTIETRNLEQTSFFPVHLAAAHPSPPCLFPLMVQVYKSQVMEPNSNGQLALAIACRFPDSNRSCDVLPKIQLLLDVFPEAAHFTDESGRLPLHIALASGVLWNDGVKSLIEVNPASLSSRDPHTGLYPFAIAAMSEEGKQVGETQLSIDTVYNVLRADPSILKI